MVKSAYTLALDCSTIQGGIAILKDTSIVVEQIWVRENTARGKSHSEMMTPTLQDVFSKAKLDFADIDLIAVNNGPGSFTGIRVATNVAKTLSFSLKKPTLCFNSHETIAGGVPLDPNSSRLLVLVNAHRNLLYASTFEVQNNSWRCTSPPRALSMESLEHSINGLPHLCVGDGFLEWENMFPPALKTLLLRRNGVNDYPNPVQLGLMARREFTTATTKEWNQIQALYIRDSEAEEKLRETQEKSSS